MRLLIAGGGTGGHLFPGISIAEEFLSRDPANEVLFVGTERGIEARVLPKLGYKLEMITAAGIRGKSRLAKAKGIAMLLFGYSQSRKILKDFKPDLVLGVGGYASGPVVMAARGLQIRRFIHEQNAIPGLTNRLLARFADRVFISLEESRKFLPEGETLLTGNPVRKQIFGAEPISPETEPMPDALRLLIFGGSAGAHSINQAVMAALPFWTALRDRLRIVHQTGDNDLNEMRDAYRTAGFTADAVSFIDDMAAAYRSANLVVCRAGATTIAEISACGKACIFIPYPHAVDDHQRKNAEALLKEDACCMLLEQELTGERLAQMVSELLQNPQRIAAMAANAGSLGRTDAAKVMVDEMLKKEDGEGLS